MRALTAVLCVSLLLPAACAAPDDEAAAAARRPIIGGVKDNGDPAVVWISANGFRCSGTLITSKIVLTAGHCIDTWMVDVFFGQDSESVGSTIDIAEGIPHPAYDENDFRSADIGLLVLARRSTVVEPIAWNRTPIDATRIGQSVRIVGFGYQNPGPAEPLGEKAQITVPIKDVTSKEIWYGPAICSGDSGGPTFLTLEDGKEYVAGVNSWGYVTEPACYDSDGGSARVDIYADWVQSVIDARDPISCEKDWRCASDCSAPDPDCPCAADGFCSELCADTDTDPDCPLGCGGGGECVSEGCPVPDPDCGDPCLAEGHCVRECAERDPDCPAVVPVGGACTESFDCGSEAHCVIAEAGAGQTCAATCTAGAAGACPEGQECNPLLPGVSVCLDAPAPPDAGCAAAPVSPGAPAWPGLAALAALAALAVTRRRR